LNEDSNQITPYESAPVEEEMSEENKESGPGMASISVIESEEK
jgi:hypothetical protein